MSILILCQGKKAKIPFIIETIGKPVYTIEEFCFYLRNYVHLLEISLFDERLTLWLEQQLMLSELAEELSQQKKQGAGLEEYVRVVFSHISYLDDEEQESLLREMNELKNLSVFERRKRRADDLVRNEKYYQALYEYGVLLDEEEGKHEETASKIYHNMGVVYSRMFYMKQAGEYFLKAFLAAPNSESLRQYKTALRLCEEQQEEDELVKAFPGAASMDIEVYEAIQEAEGMSSDKKEEVQKLRKLKSDGKVAVYYEKLEEILQTWQEECRSYMNTR